VSAFAGLHVHEARIAPPQASFNTVQPSFVDRAELYRAPTAPQTARSGLTLCPASKAARMVVKLAGF
jgi:hypothetical protein